MPQSLIYPGESTDPRVIGGKAAALSALADAGFRIPPWFVIIGDADLDVLASQIAEATAPLTDGGHALAVRSSAVDEDGAQHSFAGQLESFLNVPATDLLARVRDVRASGQSDRVLDYRRQRGLSGAPPAPAVIVQRMVNADWAGVAFAIDPVNHDESIAVVAAVRGLGEALVSGERDADTFRVDRAGAIRSVDRAAEPSGLPPEFATRIAELARRASSLRGKPQDIEWAVEAGELYLLQARPITTLSATPTAKRHDSAPQLRAAKFPDAGPPSRTETEPHPAEFTLWDNSNIAESYNGITLPLTFSFARTAYEEVYRSFCRLMSVRRDVIEASDRVYANMLGLIRGRVYYNLLNWYRLLAMLPGYAFNRRFMEQMMGVSASLSEELAQAIGQRPPGSRLAATWGLIRSVLSVDTQRGRLPRTMRAFYVRLNKALGPDASRLSSLSAVQLAAHYRTLQDRLLKRWDAPIVNDFLAMFFHGLLRSLCTKWIDATHETLHNDLVRGVEGVVSVEPAVRLRRMAEIARGDASLVDTLQSGDLAAMQAAIAAHPALARELNEYLEKFADRCLEELKLESPTLADDPTTLLRSIGHLASQRRDAAPLGAMDAEAAARAKALVRRRLRWRPLRRVIFNWVTRNARERVRDRENLRFERTRLFGRVRRVFVEIGNRLTAQGLLADPRDVFYLEVNEVLGYIEGTATTLDLGGLVTIRKTQYDIFAREPAPPARFSTHGMVNPLDARARAPEPIVGDARSRRGIGCCAGRVRGRVRVITDPRGAHLEAGEILVAERTDPGWVMLFPASAGVLVERGSLLSHSAIVSRELGIPGIVSIPGLTTWLRTGDEVEFDGSTGVVTLLAATTAPTPSDTPFAPITPTASVARRPALSDSPAPASPGGNP